jgi:hypothetical protein
MLIILPPTIFIPLSLIAANFGCSKMFKVKQFPTKMKMQTNFTANFAIALFKRFFQDELMKAFEFNELL